MWKDCMDIPIDDFDASEECRHALKAAGFRTIGEVVEFLQQNWLKADEEFPGTLGINTRLLKYIDETLARLKATDCWPDNG